MDNLDQNRKVPSPLRVGVSGTVTRNIVEGKKKNAKLLAKDKACITITNQLNVNLYLVNLYADKIMNILGDYC